MAVVHWGNKLRELAESTGVPKGSIAAALGITSGSLSSTFGSESVRIDTIYKICEVCGVKPWQFLASIDSSIPADAFAIIENLFKHPIEKRIIILRILKDASLLALCADDDKK